MMDCQGCVMGVGGAGAVYSTLDKACRANQNKGNVNRCIQLPRSTVFSGIQGSRGFSPASRVPCLTVLFI